eukprot:TRINITY_DN55302_c0_g1_i1.p1 TRINITY_DN55302_c0_g1~~TRINITY_DN55302_c0_g1_i1.p1  ORF type:complete len:235 (+),score=56.47 TRINITY_DN55302_c0_g1_i1:263-967(+)
MEERKDAPEKFWKKTAADDESKKRWYAKAEEYWEGREATLEGILGGFPETSEPDLHESAQFLAHLRSLPKPPQGRRALDAGAGIGRVTAALLLPHFEKVDLVEPCAKHLEAAKAQLSSERCEKFELAALQDFVPEEKRYDMIWNQGVILYLPDDDLVKWFQRCQKGLADGGVICIKENVILDGRWMVDWEDNSVARTDEQLKAIFQRAGLTIVHEARQQVWSEELLPVKMYALR